jgi:hypothetical protein
MRTNFFSLSRRAETLIHRCAPEFADLPAYFANESGPGLLGFTSPDQDILIRKKVWPWRDRGFGAVLNFGMMRAMVPCDMIQGLFLSVALHEYAHCLTESYLVGIHDRPIPKQTVIRSFNRTYAAEMARTPTAEDSRRLARREFLNHNEQWILAGLHLRYRAERLAGIRLPSSQVVGWRQFQSRPEKYEAVLVMAGEFQRHLGSTFTDILANVPEDFAAIRAEDEVRYVQECKQETGARVAG